MSVTVVNLTVYRMDVNHLDCLEKYEKLIRSIRFILWNVGLDVFDPSCRLINRRSVLTYITMATFWTCEIYTMFIYRDNFIECVKTATTSGPVALVTAKIVTLATNSRAIYEIHQKNMKLHLNSRDIYTKCLNIWTKRMSLTANICMILYKSTGALFILGPIAVYVLNGEKILVIPVQPPFIDITNWTGFLITSAYEVQCSIWASAILASVDATFIVLCFTGVAYLDMIGLKCEKLTENIEKLEDKSSKITEKDVSNLLKDIIHTGLALDRFVSETQEQCILRSFIITYRFRL